MIVSRIENIPEDLKEKFAELWHRKISDLYECEDSYLVIFSWNKEDGDATGRNLWRVSKDFKVLWKIEPMSKHYPKSVAIPNNEGPFTGLAIKAGQLKAYNMIGAWVGLNFETGETTKIDGQRLW